MAREPHRAGKSEPARQLRRGLSAWQLEQGQRVAMRLGDDLVADPRIDRPGERRVEQRPGVIVSPVPAIDELGRSASSRVGALAAKTRPTDSAPSRRAANARTCAEA